VSDRAVSWQELYDEAVARFGGQTPGAALEASVVAVFVERPAAVHAAVVKLGDRFASGRVRSPWALMLAELEQGAGREQVVASERGDRERLVRLAERRVANLGHVLPSEAELVEELFGRRALLEPWAHDDELRARMVDLWRRQARTPIRWPTR
jgi:hypothetical protein